MTVSAILRDLTALVRNDAPPALLPPRFHSYIVVEGDTVRFDTAGIPMVRPWSGIDGAFHYNPTTVAQWGLGGYARGDYALAQKACEWLVEWQHPNGGFPLTFRHTVSGQYDLAPPWYSAISQGNAMSLLSRMYALTGNPLYRMAAKHALHLLDKPVAQGGLRSELNGGVWFEETPADPPNHIFNGSVFALLGIGDCAEHCGYGSELWTEGEASLRANINAHIVWAPFHESAPSNLPDPWGVYDLRATPNYLGRFYMQLHCELIEEMAARTGHATYSGTAAALRAALAAYGGQ